MYSVGPDYSGGISVLYMPRSMCLRGLCVLRGRISWVFMDSTATKYVYVPFPCTSWSLLDCDEVSQHDSCHSFHYDRGTEGEADVVTARHLEGVHLAGLEVECLLGLSDA